MTVELWGLVIIAGLTLVHVSVQGLWLKASVGNAWTVGARDQAVDEGVIAARAKRAMVNFLETAPAFIALALVATLASRESFLTQLGTITYLVGRTFYLPAYLVGAVWVRTVIWNAATAGLAAMLVGVLFP